MSYGYEFLMALGVTISIETIVLFLSVRFLLKINNLQIPNSLLLFAGFITSFATLPYVWFIIPFFFKNNFILYGLTAEIFAFACEGIIYYFLLNLDIKKAMLASFVCNAASFLLGLIFFRVG